MLPTSQLPVGIYTGNCLAWSSDGELAVAAGEEVYLLLPRHGTGEPWTDIRFQVCVFTYDEWPRKPQASFADMSIGEEQARVTITSLAWSPSGIAKHGRCVLAILTTNLRVSLWAPGGDPTDAESWQRVLILNETRVRSMSWVPVGFLNTENQISSLAIKREIPLLAVSDDENGISFLNVLSPFTPDSSYWDFQTIRHERIPPVIKKHLRPSLLQSALDSKHFIDYIAFGGSDSAGKVLLTYRSSGAFYQTTLTISSYPLRATLEATPHQSVAQAKHDRPPKAPAFMQGAMHECMEHYAKLKRLTVDRVLLKTWGVASFGNIVGVCITSHPAKMVEYYAIVQSSATIVFGHCKATGGAEPVFPWQIPKEIDEGLACQKILLTVFDRHILASSILAAMDLKVLYAAICASLFHRMPEPQRLDCLVYAEHAVELLEIQSNKILQAEREAIAAMKVRESIDPEILDISLNRVIDGSSAPDVQFLDSCPICEDCPVGFRSARENFSAAYCTNGHPFSRCALTFLPILEPGCSKRCTICKREFLKEEKLSAGELKTAEAMAVDDGEAPAKMSLTAFLFEKFGVCPYCGGKYYDSSHNATNNWIYDVQPITIFGQTKA